MQQPKKQQPAKIRAEKFFEYIQRDLQWEHIALWDEIGNQFDSMRFTYPANPPSFDQLIWLWLAFGGAAQVCNNRHSSFLATVHAARQKWRPNTHKSREERGYHLYFDGTDSTGKRFKTVEPIDHSWATCSYCHRGDEEPGCEKCSYEHDLYDEGRFQRFVEDPDWMRRTAAEILASARKRPRH